MPWLLLLPHPLNSLPGCLASKSEPCSDSSASLFIQLIWQTVLGIPSLPRVPAHLAEPQPLLTTPGRPDSVLTSNLALA